MSNLDLTPLILNAALLLALVMLYDFATMHIPMAGKPFRQVINGVILGCIGMGIMLSPWHLEPGVVFDMRSVLLGISGLFLGPVPTIIAMAMTATLRLSQGGAAMWAGTFVILASGCTGILWRRYRPGAIQDISWREFYLFGVLIHVVMVLLMLVMPWNVALRVIARIAFPVLFLYPWATTALGLLLANRFKREQAAREYMESEGRYRSLFENNHAVMLIIDPTNGVVVDANPAACAFYGWTHGELVGRHILTINTLDPEKLRIEMDRAITGQSNHFFFRHRLANGSMRDVETFSGPISIKGRQLLYSINHDITIRKQAEAETARLISEIEASHVILLSVVEEQKKAEEIIRRLNEELEQRVLERTTELESANQELEAFSYSVSHDLRAPLRAINGFADILVQTQGHVINEDGHHALEVIRTEALRLGQLIDDLLEFLPAESQGVKEKAGSTIPFRSGPFTTT